MFNNAVIVHDKLPKDEKKRLTEELNNYWDDSIKARKAQVAVFWYKLKNPPQFDSVNIIRSKRFMNSLLNAKGYYYANLKDSIVIDTVKNQYRTSSFMHVHLGKKIILDTISYAFTDSTLQKVAMDNSAQASIKKGDAYTKADIGNELERLTNLFRQRGYLKLFKEDLVAEADSTDKQLLAFTLDPLEMANSIQKAAQRRKENPTWSFIIKNRPVKDSSKFIQYKAGNFYYYPETKITDIIDSIINSDAFNTRTYKETIIKDKAGKFDRHPLREHTFLRKGDILNESIYFKSINSLGQIGAWQSVDAKVVTHNSDTADIHFFLTPHKKQNYSFDLETSRNTGSGSIIAGNFLGVSTNFSYRNRNVWKQAIQSLTNLRAGVELSLADTVQLLQSTQFSLSHSYSFPRLILPYPKWNLWGSLMRLDEKRTLFSVNAAYTERREIFRLRSLTMSWGYEFKKRNTVYQVRIPSLELYGLERLSGLDLLIAQNPFLAYAFNNGNIVSMGASVVNSAPSKRNPNNAHYFRLSLDESGALTSTIKSLKDKVFKYIRFEGEYRFLQKKPKSELAYRLFTGIGWNYSNDATVGQVMPFFKQFAVGGPNSMRAWQIRQLGLGSSIANDTVRSTFRDRFGDMQIEANLEYRFVLMNIGSFKIGGALFTDIGNIWNVNKNAGNPGAEFSIDRFTKDIAIAVGTGIRLDFGYFLIRVDGGIKLKDPARPYNNGWMDINNFKFKETRSNGAVVSNGAIQLGIGLPF